MKNHIFIGDNLLTIKHSSFSEFKGKIDFIYIDPPYNTKGIFSYNDKNDEWASDIEKRLIAAHEIMSKNAVIFISIDDSELVNLLSICYKIFGKENYIGLIITKQAQRSNAKHINIIHEYVVCFGKNKKSLPEFFIKRLENPSESQHISAIINKVKKQFLTSMESATELLKQLIEKHISDTGKTWIRNYSNVDKNGRIYFAKDLSTPGKPSSLVIDELGINLEALKTRGWSSKEKIISLHKQNKLVFKGKRPYEIDFLDDAVDNISSLQDFYSRHGTNDLKKMNLDGLFDTPKPVELIKFLIRSSQHKDALILDFYAGSGTTAQAVYEVNLEDKRNHKFILIQLDETINPKTEPYKILKSFGYENPKVSDALFLRLTTFLKLKNIERDYIVVNKVYE